MQQVTIELDNTSGSATEENVYIFFRGKTGLENLQREIISRILAVPLRLGK